MKNENNLLMKRILLYLLIANYYFLSFAQDLTLRYDRPADYFEEALVIGNGTMGGIIYGGTNVDKISLNDITLWTGEPEHGVYSPDAYKAIPDIRAALDKGDYKLADELQRKVQGHFSQNYQPLGELQIQYADTTEQISNYRRWLDISNATVHTVYHRGKYQYSTEYFASNPDSGIVIRLTTDNPAGINARFSLSCQLRNNIYTSSGIKGDGCRLINDGYAGYGSLPSYYEANEKFAYDENRGIHFRTEVEVVSSNLSPKDNGIEVRASKEVIIYVVNATSFNGYDKDPVKEGRDYKSIADNTLSHITSLAYDNLLINHINDYKSIFDRVSLKLSKGGGASSLTTDKQLLEYLDESKFNPDLEALYFQYGRYLLISCSRTPNVPANLQGLWNEYLLPPWSCNYTSNINLEENYWPSEIANMPETHMSLLTFLKELQGSGEQTAKAYYNVDKGWCLAHNTDIWAMTNPVGLNTGDPNWANWNMGGAWVSTHIWEHYMFSLDKAFLEEYYPVLKGAAEFCLGWMTEKDGKLITSPATSPENIYVNDDGYHGRTFYGGSADIAMIRECLIAAKNSAIELGKDKDFVAQIEATLPRLMPYKIGKRGNIQEWYYDWDDEDPHHRHQSHLFGLFPGHNLADGTNSEADLLKAAARTLEIKGDQTTGWSTGWRVNLYARLGDAKNAYHIYRKLLSYISPDKYKGPDARRGGGTYPNLLDAHSPFQIDGNFGGCAGVIEMLMQSQYKVRGERLGVRGERLETKGKPMPSITLLPALPANWKDGEVRGIRARGGLTIDMIWSDSKVTSLKISSLRSCKLTLTMNGATKVVKLKKGMNIVK